MQEGGGTVVPYPLRRRVTLEAHHLLGHPGGKRLAYAVNLKFVLQERYDAQDEQVDRPRDERSRPFTRREVFRVEHGLLDSARVQGQSRTCSGQGPHHVGPVDAMDDNDQM